MVLDLKILDKQIVMPDFMTAHFLTPCEKESRFAIIGSVQTRPIDSVNSSISFACFAKQLTSIQLFAQFE
jgi:hypothetical protein